MGNGLAYAQPLKRGVLCRVVQMYRKHCTPTPY